MAFIGNTNTTQAFTPAIDYFSGNGSTTAFTLSRPVASVAQVQAVVNNVAQNPSDAFTVSGSTITFTSAPLSGTNNVYVYYTSPITQVIAPSQGTVQTAQLGNITNIASGNSSLTLQTGSSNTTAITVDASQNVGIGTASPSSKLSVVHNQNGASQVSISNNTGGASSQALFSATDGTNYGQFGMWGSGVSASGAQQPSNAYVYGSGGISYFTGGTHRWYYSTNTEAMRIDSSGNLLVGTTSTFSPGGVPTTTSFSTNTAGNWALGIRNTTTASNPFGLAIQYPNGAPNSGSAQFIFCQDNTGTKFDVRSNGGIGNYSANNANLSDQREKKNIQLAPNYLDKICQIPVKTFLFNDQTDTDLNLGSIAQDVQAVCPELITESNWGTEEEPKMRLSIYQTDLQYALMKSIQELKAINDTQAETINALTARIVALENR